MTAPTPHWLRDLPSAEQPYARRRYLMRLAALLVSQEGHVAHLSTAAGLSNPKSISIFMTLQQKRKMPRRMAERIEKATGGVVTAEALLDGQT